MQVWSSADYRRMPWKNGGGFTTECLSFPPGANLEQFIWRLSMAEVNSNGPFSHFAGIDRTLAILHGEGIVMHGLFDDQGAPISLTQLSLPHAFSGETPINAALLEGPVIDLNMMSRNAICTHHVTRLTAGEHLIEARQAQQLIIFCDLGNLSFATGETLNAKDCAVLDEVKAGEGITTRLHASEDSRVFMIRIQFHGENAHG